MPACFTGLDHSAVSICAQADVEIGIGTRHDHSDAIDVHCIPLGVRQRQRAYANSVSTPV